MDAAPQTGESQDTYRRTWRKGNNDEKEATKQEQITKDRHTASKYYNRVTKAVRRIMTR
jgi:hypothetical protein